MCCFLFKVERCCIMHVRCVLFYARNSKSQLKVERSKNKHDIYTLFFQWQQYVSGGVSTKAAQSQSGASFCSNLSVFWIVFRLLYQLYFVEFDFCASENLFFKVKLPPRWTVLLL